MTDEHKLTRAAEMDLFAENERLRRKAEALDRALGEAIYWDGQDAEGVDAVWLEQARAARAALGQEG